MDNLDFFDSTIVIRGRSYYRNKDYEITSIDENHVDATVFGSNDYDVHLSFKSDGRMDVNKSYCTCPCPYPCKHMACIVLAYEEKNRNTKTAANNQDFRIKGLITRGEDTLKYLTNTYSATAYVSSAINELEKQWKNASEENKDILSVIIFKILEKYTNTENYYSSYYEEPEVLFDRLVACINDKEKATNLLLDSINKANDIKIGFFNSILKTSQRKDILQDALIKLFLEEKESILQQKLTMPSHCLPCFDINLIPNNIKLDFLRLFYSFISNKSKIELIDEIFLSNENNKIVCLAKILLVNIETTLLSKNDIEKIDQIDHKLALQCILKMSNSNSLSWITFYKTFSNNEDTLENNTFDTNINKIIDKGNPTPKLIYPNLEVDLRKTSVENIYELLECIDKGYYLKIGGFLFKKIEKDFNLKTKKPDEIALGLLCLDKIDASLAKKLILNEKCFNSIAGNQNALAIYFELINHYGLLDKVGYEKYGE